MSQPLCPNWKKCDFSVFPHASTFTAHCDFTVICLPSLTGTGRSGKVPKVFQNTVGLTSEWLLPEANERFTPDSSHKARKFTWFNKIFHMPVVVCTVYPKQNRDIISQFRAATRKQEKLLQKPGDAVNELRFAFRLNLLLSKQEKFEVIFPACFLDACWQFKCMSTILWHVHGCVYTCWLFMWTPACAFTHILRAYSYPFDNTSKLIFQCLPMQRNNPVVAFCSQDTWGTVEQQ